jgi:hypothetical protein
VFAGLAISYLMYKRQRNSARNADADLPARRRTLGYFDYGLRQRESRGTVPGRLSVDVSHLQATSTQWAGCAAELSGAPAPPIAKDWPSGLAIGAIHVNAAVAASTLQDRLGATATHVGLAANAYAANETSSSDPLRNV